ncbi:MAG: RIP homotypic interaction motif-containing protein [Syntrophales bacterium]|nr:RIP homotypic interaction motif-containing protein [Syntrophales bacterium]
MSPFTELLNEEVYIVAPNGERQGPFKTAIGKGSATIFDETIDVEEGYKLVKPLPNGKAEIYTIVETKHNNDFHGIPAHYALKVRKDSSLVDRNQPPKSTTVNIHNSHGFQIGDHNVQTIAISLQALLNKINESSVTEPEKAAARGKLRQLIENPVIASILGGLASGITW